MTIAATDLRMRDRHRTVTGRSLAVSSGAHLLVILLLAVTLGRGSAPVTPSLPPVPITLPASTTRPLPKPAVTPPGDLPVRAVAKAPFPTPTPLPSPTPRRQVIPSPSPRPTPRPTSRVIVTPSPLLRPTPRTVNAKEQAEFQVMRSIPYFSKMSDEELRQQRIPPGMHSWGEVIAMGKRLDGLNWLFLPPETGPASAPPSAPASPWPSGIAPDVWPSPVVSVDAQGLQTLRFQMQEGWLVARWKPEGTTVTVSMVVPDETAPRFSYEVPIGDDMAEMAKAIALGYLQATGQITPSPSDSPGPEPTSSP